MRDFADKVVAPAAYQYDTERRAAARHRRADGRAGAVRPAVPEGVRRAGRRLLRPLPRGRGARARRPVASRSRSRPASGSARCRSSASAPRRRSSAGCPTCSPGSALAGFGLTEAERGIGCRGHQDHGASRRRRVGDQRHQAVHHQLRHGDHELRHDHRGDRREGRRRRPQEGALHDHRAERHPRLHRRARLRQGRLAHLRHAPAHASRTCACPRRTCSGSAAAGSRTSSTSSTRAASRSPRSRGAARGLPRGGDALREEAQRVRRADRREPAHRVHDRAMQARVHTARLAWHRRRPPLVAGKPFKIEAAIAKLHAARPRWTTPATRRRSSAATAS